MTHMDGRASGYRTGALGTVPGKALRRTLGKGFGRGDGADPGNWNHQEPRDVLHQVLRACPTWP